MSPFDPLYLLIIATGLLVIPSSGVSVVWLVAVAIGWPVLHRPVLDAVGR